jgi:hypothetical protein
MMDAYSEGKSDLAVCKDLGVSKKQFDSYIARSEPFREAVEFGRELAQAWWEEQSRINLQNKDFNTALFKARMQKFYDWSDKVDQKNTNHTEGDINKLKEELALKMTDIKTYLPENVEVRVLEHNPTPNLPSPDTGD